MHLSHHTCLTNPFRQFTRFVCRAAGPAAAQSLAQDHRRVWCLSQVGQGACLWLHVQEPDKHLSQTGGEAHGHGDRSQHLGRTLLNQHPWITIIIILPRWVTRALFVFGGYGTTIISCRELGGDGCHLLLWSIHHQDMELAGRLCPRRNDSNRLGCKQEQEAIRRIGDGNCGTWHCLV